MSAKRPCLRCGQEMAGHWSHICPQCGKFFAFYTREQTAILLVVAIVVALVVNVAVVGALWFLA